MRGKLTNFLILCTNSTDRLREKLTSGGGLYFFCVHAGAVGPPIWTSLPLFGVMELAIAHKRIFSEVEIGMWLTFAPPSRDPPLALLKNSRGAAGTGIVE